MGHSVFRHIYDDFKSFRETDFQKVDVQSDEDKFVTERDDLLFFALDHVSVDARQLVGVQAGLFRLLFTDEAVQDVEGVEKEVWIDLPLELQVSVLGHVGLFFLRLHLHAHRQAIVYHIYDAVDGYLDYQRDDQQQYQVLSFRSYEEGFEKGCQSHEGDVKRCSAGLRNGLFPCRQRSDEHDVDADQYDKGEGIRHHLPDHLEHDVLSRVGS